MNRRTVLLRVWLPDRPGALGAVAGRVGAVGGDVVGIDILESGAGRAIDELWLELPPDTDVQRLIDEVSALDGVDIETCRDVEGTHRSSGVHAHERSLELLAAADPAAVRRGLAAAATELCAADAAVVAAAGTDEPAVLHIAEGHESAIDARWLEAFAAGAASVAGDGGPTLDDTDFPDLSVSWLPASRQVLVVSRRGLAIRAKERRLLHALAATADHRLAEL